MVGSAARSGESSPGERVTGTSSGIIMDASTPSDPVDVVLAMMTADEKQLWAALQ